MRIWDIPTNELCRVHLLAEHRELHGIWAILTQGKKGYRNHPETMRWDGKLAALYARHEEEAADMALRGYNHKSPLDILLATGDNTQSKYLLSVKKQRKLLRQKHGIN